MNVLKRLKNVGLKLMDIHVVVNVYLLLIQQMIKNGH